MSPARYRLEKLGHVAAGGLAVFGFARWLLFPLEPWGAFAIAGALYFVGSLVLAALGDEPGPPDPVDKLRDLGLCAFWACAFALWWPGIAFCVLVNLFLLNHPD